jgi:thymidylate synthase
MTSEQPYLDLLKKVMTHGHLRETRNGVTRALFGEHLSFSLADGRFPLLTTKKMFLRGIFEELRFFLLGKTDSKYLEERGVTIWRPNTSREFLDTHDKEDYEEGDMGPMYFYQIYHFNAPYKGCHANYEGQGFNQFEEVLHLLRVDRFSRRMVMTTYNPLQADEGVLYPCHGLVIQFGVEDENRLCLHMYQRSMDIALGAPFNIASYALLVYIVCALVNTDLPAGQVPFVPYRIDISVGDCHVYQAHVEGVTEQLSREPYEFPRLAIAGEITADFSRLSFDQLMLTGYTCHPAIKMPMIA